MSSFCQCPSFLDRDRPPGSSPVGKHSSGTPCPCTLCPVQDIRGIWRGLCTWEPGDLLWCVSQVSLDTPSSDYSRSPHEGSTSQQQLPHLPSPRRLRSPKEIRKLKCSVLPPLGRRPRPTPTCAAVCVWKQISREALKAQELLVISQSITPGDVPCEPTFITGFTSITNSRRNEVLLSGSTIEPGKRCWHVHFEAISHCYLKIKHHNF